MLYSFRNAYSYSSNLIQMFCDHLPHHHMAVELTV